MKRSFTVLLYACILLAGSAAHAADIVPNEIQMPGTQPNEVGNFESPDKCDNCHAGYNLADPGAEPATGWRGAAMGNAGRDAVFWATLAVAEQGFDGAGDLCIRCHSAGGWYGGRSTPTDGSGLAASDNNGAASNVATVTIDVTAPMACSAYITKGDCNGDPNCEWVGSPNNGFCQDAGAPAEICDDGIDNDGDGLTDCADGDCSGDPACQTGACDNDGVCDPGEDCLSCANDCAGVTSGKPANRYCCGNGVAEAPEGDGSVCDGNY